jgi:hypothetical protein
MHQVQRDSTSLTGSGRPPQERRGTGRGQTVRALDEAILESVNLILESNRRLHYFATATAAGWSFPCLWVPIRRLDKFYETRGQQARESIVRLLASSWFAQINPAPATLRELIAMNARVEDPHIRATQRVYLVLTELFNFAVRRIFVSREWLDPWSCWKYFLVEPWDVQEGRFINMCAAVFSITTSNLAARCEGDKAIHLLVEYLAQPQLPIWRREVPPSEGHFKTDFERQFAGHLRRYLVDGTIHWTTRCGHYVIENYGERAS